MVRPGRELGPARHDRVVARPVGTVAAHPVLQLVADVGLGRPFGQHRHDGGQRGVGDLRGLVDPGQLAGVLARRSCSTMPPAGSSGEALGERGPRRVAEVLGLGEHGRRRQPPRGDHRVDQLRALRAHLQLGAERAVARPLAARSAAARSRVAPVGDEHQPLARRARPTPSEPPKPVSQRMFVACDSTIVRPSRAARTALDTPDEVGRRARSPVCTRPPYRAALSAPPPARRAADGRVDRRDDLDAAWTVEHERQAIAGLLVAAHQLEQPIVVDTRRDRRRQAVRPADDGAVGGDPAGVDAPEGGGELGGVDETDADRLAVGQTRGRGDLQGVGERVPVVEQRPVARPHARRRRRTPP